MNKAFWQDVFNEWARKYGQDAAREKFRGNVPDEDLEEFYNSYGYQLKNVFESRPAAIRPAGLEPWYPGPLPDDHCWPSLRDHYLEVKNRPEDQVESVDEASNVVVAHTPRPDQRSFKGRGLVVGYIQSGKTTNFTAVAAKAADLGYHLVIVLSGIHNSLRKQTQNRLASELTDLNTNKWLPLTTDEKDFFAPPFNGEAALGDTNATGLMVVKKNPVVLRRVRDWLGKKGMKEHLKNLCVLVIDDEADQASVGTATINPLIREILALMPKNTYVGYTATPFANVFIDPTESEDFYPRDFILNLPRPDGYFGPEMIFGRPGAPNESEEAAGYDMVRLVDHADLNQLRPATKKDIPTFSPKVEGVLSRAVDWYFLATAARLVRGQEEHSAMLVHTHLSTDVHEKFRKPLEDYRDRTYVDLIRADEATLRRFRLLWSEESAAVPAEAFQRASISFETLLGRLPEVVKKTRIVLDNYKSKDRLDYTKSTEPQYVIAVGANTLSRGLTLEGLVSSVFVRAARAYDTLLQMGRWFGFRPGYEELPRIWMTEELRNNFSHLAQVEHEMRGDISRYQEQGMNPTHVAVRILTHPSLAITAKMGAAKVTEITYEGHSLTTRYFDVSKESILRDNLNAAIELASSVQIQGDLLPESEDHSGTLVYDDVPAAVIVEFLQKIQIHEDQPNMASKLLVNFINDSRELSDGYLENWTVAFIAGGGKAIELGPFNEFRTSIRSAELPDPAKKRIHTLTNPTDFGLGLGMSRKNLKEAAGGAASDPRMLRLRGLDPIQSRKGILLVYPLDPISAPTVETSSKMVNTPLNAAGGVPPIGIGIGFPERDLSSSPASGKAPIRTRMPVDLYRTYMSVDLPDELDLSEDELKEAFETDSEDS